MPCQYLPRSWDPNDWSLKKSVTPIRVGNGAPVKKNFNNLAHKDFLKAFRLSFWTNLKYQAVNTECELGTEIAKYFVCVSATLFFWFFFQLVLSLLFMDS